MLHGKELSERGAEDVWGWSTPAGQERVKARAAWIKRACGLRPGVEVLECGCGTGVFTRQLALTGATVTAVDISTHLLDTARRSCPAHNVTFSTANLEDPVELPDGKFDVMCGVSILHHLALPDALCSLRKKLKDGALFAFSEPNLLNPINRHVIFSDNPAKRMRLGVSPTEMAFYADELKSLFIAAGFKVFKLEYRDFLHPCVPRNLIPLFKAIEFVAERLPFVQRLSGSLWIWGTV